MKVSGYRLVVREANAQHPKKARTRHALSLHFTSLGSDLCKMILSLIVFIKYKKIMQMFLNIRIK